MSASEFAFLALGLVLGVVSGAALIEVLRARPPVSREVRVTVAPNAISPRVSTLSDPTATADATGPARGGPADRRWRDEIIETGEPATTGRRLGRGRGERAAAGSPAPSAADRDAGTPVRSDSATDRGREPIGVMPAASDETPARPEPLWLSPAAGSPGSSLVAVPMSLEPDPITAALRATAAASAVAAMAASTAPAVLASARSKSGGTGGSGSAGVGQASAATGGGANATAGRSSDGRASDGGATAAPASAPVADGPCAEERRVADERCALATRARDGATTAAETLRQAQRTYDEILARTEADAARADPRAVRSAKEEAQQRFRDARTTAQTRDDVEAGARAWLADINQINQAMRDARNRMERDRAAALELAPNLERLAVEADAARIAAERADEACIAAREAVAQCDEARTLEAAAARSAVDAPGPPPAGPPPRIAAATPEPEDELGVATPMHSRAREDALILQILRGDREAMQLAVAKLGGDDREARLRWQRMLSALAEALIARSIEASSFDFPLEHPFWGPFSQAQNRDIAAGLSSLGFRFDGFGGWVDDHQPSQRDLSLAVGYAGLDPMRVRRWPTEAETTDLLREVRVAADEYVAGAAGSLTLGELVTMLGRRADGLTELWNEWGSVRPVLASAA